MEASTYLIKSALSKAGFAPIKLGPTGQRALMGALQGGFNGVVPGMVGGGLSALQTRDPNDLKADQAINSVDNAVRNIARGGVLGTLGGAAGGALGALAGGGIRPSKFTNAQAKGYIPKGQNPLSTDVRYPMPGLEVPGMQIGSHLGGALGGYGGNRAIDSVSKAFSGKSKKVKDKEIDSELKELPSPLHAAVSGGVNGAVMGGMTSPFLKELFASQPRSTILKVTKGLSMRKGALVGGAIGAGTGALRNVLIRHFDKDRLAQAKTKKPKESKTDKDKGDK